MDRIHIFDLEVDGILGIKPEERVNKQVIRVNVTLWVDTARAAKSDDIDDAVNYRTITKAIVAHIEEGEPYLVERLVAEIAEICFETDSRITEAEVRVEKPGALRHARSVGITIHRTREEVTGG
ncbi:MAG: dihydroneopterin aldolase [Acidimicrobiia bacterium]|nr:dihydroneopterin aldolase [Acidimicrobiia bacterium]NNC74455.1 dihydroneopterin aldolase [Acidimicrobiia bacterium]